jgi:hypothetical protein
MDVMTFTEYGVANNLTDEELIAYMKKEYGFDEEDARLLLAIERGETDGDVIEGE